MGYLSFVGNLISIWGGVSILCSIVLGNPKSEKFYYDTTCDLSCASVTVHDVRNAQGRICLPLVFTVFERSSLYTL